MVLNDLLVSVSNEFKIQKHSLSSSLSVKMGDLIYYNSVKGNPKLACKGFVYTKDKSKGQTWYWKCERGLDGCTGRLTVKDGIITKEKEHNHAPDTLVAEVQMSISKMKETIKSGRECTSAVTNRHLEEVDKQFRPYFPSEGAIKKALQRTRRKDQPALPQTLNDISIEGL